MQAGRNRPEVDGLRPRRIVKIQTWGCGRVEPLSSGSGGEGVLVAALHLRPLPQGQGSFRPRRASCEGSSASASPHNAPGSAREAGYGRALTPFAERSSEVRDHEALPPSLSRTVSRVRPLTTAAAPVPPSQTRNGKQAAARRPAAAGRRERVSVKGGQERQQTRRGEEWQQQPLERG